MYTYTHFAIGASVGAWICRNEPNLPLWSAKVGLLGIAAALPDAAMVSQLTIQKLMGRAPTVDVWWPQVSEFNYVTHSFYVIFAILACLLGIALWRKICALKPLPRLLPWFALLWLSHPVVDSQTHGVLPTRYDYLWPSNFHLGRFFSWYNYRIPGTLWPGLPETAIVAVCLFAFFGLLLAWLKRHNGWPQLHALVIHSRAALQSAGYW